MRGRQVAIVGAGNAGGQAALHLAKHAAQVTVIVRGQSLEASMSEYLITEIDERPNIAVRFGVEVVDSEGADRLRGVVIRARGTGDVERLPVEGLFVMIGADPHTEWLEDTVQRDRSGYVVTGGDVEAGEEWGGEAPLLLETSVPGVFAAGDVRAGSIKRVTTAMGEGATVVQLVHQSLSRRRRVAAG
jgi:thioredoxin reductase (NADPH)